VNPNLQSSIDTMNHLNNISDTLSMRDTDNQLVPRLATEWEAVDELRWRFRLRDDATFHNGEPFDAHAVKFSIERLIAPETGSTIIELRSVSHVEIVDDLTADIVMSDPDPVIPEKVSLSGGVMLPPKYLQDVGPDAYATDPLGPG